MPTVSTSFGSAVKIVASANAGADLHIASGINFSDRGGMTDDQKSLSDIKMKPTTVIMLNQHGYETLEEMAHLSSAEILRMPGMGGSDWASSRQHWIGSQFLNYLGERKSSWRLPPDLGTCLRPPLRMRLKLRRLLACAWPLRLTCLSSTFSIAQFSMEFDGGWTAKSGFVAVVDSKHHADSLFFRKPSRFVVTVFADVERPRDSFTASF